MESVCGKALLVCNGSNRFRTSLLLSWSQINWFVLARSITTDLLINAAEWPKRQSFQDIRFNFHTFYET